MAQNVKDTVLRRFARLREVARTAMYFASDAAGAMTGADDRRIAEAAVAAAAAAGHAATAD